MSKKIDLAKLSAVPYTLMIPLVARARGGEFLDTQFLRDRTAEDVLRRLGQSGDEFMHEGTICAIEARTRIFVDLARAFFLKNPTSMGGNLGCGLSNYFQWLDAGRNRFLDADLPEVMQIRRQLLEPINVRHRFDEISLTSPDWWEKLQTVPGEPMLLMVEGVSMYLKKREVHEVLRTFGEKAPNGSEILVDFMSWLSIGQARSHSPVMKQTGAEFRWGARRIADLTSPHERLNLISVGRPLKNRSIMGGLEFLFQKLTSVPFYGIAQIGVK